MRILVDVVRQRHVPSHGVPDVRELLVEGIDVLRVLPPALADDPGAGVRAHVLAEPAASTKSHGAKPNVLVAVSHRRADVVLELSSAGAIRAGWPTAPRRAVPAGRTRPRTPLGCLRRRARPSRPLPAGGRARHVADSLSWSELHHGLRYPLGRCTPRQLCADSRDYPPRRRSIPDRSRMVSSLCFALNAETAGPTYHATLIPHHQDRRVRPPSAFSE